MWVVLALAAVGYLSLVVLRPDLLATHLPQGPQTGPAEPNGTRATAAAMAEVQELHTTVAELRNDLASVKRDIEASDARSRRLADQLAALQGLPPAETGSLSPPELRLESAPVIAPRAEIKTAPAAAPVQTAKVLNETKTPAAATKAPAAIETGSVKPAPAVEAPLFETAVVKPAPKTLALQIASGSSLDSLRLSWNLLSETHAGSLKNLEPRYSTGVDANGLVYNLMAGPVKTEAEAKKMCKDLTAKAIPCKVVGDFDGPSL